MTTALSRHGENLETYFLIWLDAAVNSSEENIQAQQNLRTLINHLTTFDDDAECEEYIRSVAKEDRIALIVSGQLGEKVVPRIHGLQQVSLIYIYCINKEQHEQWAHEFNKVKAVVVRLEDLIKMICSDQKHRQHGKIDEAFSINIFSTGKNGEGQSTSEINGDFVHSQLLMDCLTRMEPKSSNKDELITICKKEYQGNEVELQILKEFEETYVPNCALWWYTRQSFLYRLLNKALRVQNIDLLFLFRFFIRDLEQQLTDNRCTSSSIRVYRGQLMSKDEIEILKNSTGQFISINSFLSTSLDRELARFFIANANVSTDFACVFFEIDADPNLQNIKPFSNITSYSYFHEEEEVLFMLGSIFQLICVYYNQDGIWIVRMQLCSDDDHQLKSLLKFLKTESNTNENILISFGNVLLKMGRFNDAENYYRRCLNEGSSERKCIARCCHLLGVVVLKKGDLDSSLELLNKSLDIQLQTLSSDDPSVAANYNSIGKAFRKKDDLDQAIKMFERALRIWEIALGDNSQEIAKCYTDIGNVYQRQQLFVKALKYHQKALNINERDLPKYHRKSGASHVHIAAVYRCLEEYDLSLKHANLALEIFEKSLPAQHSHIAWVLENIGLVYEQQEKLEESLSYLKKAANIHHQTLPSTHYYITGIERNIQRVASRGE